MAEDGEQEITLLLRQWSSGHQCGYPGLGSADLPGCPGLRAIAARDVARGNGPATRCSPTALVHKAYSKNRLRQTAPATELLEQGWTYEDVAEVLGNSAAIVKKHYAKWSRGRQNRLNADDGVSFFGTEMVHDRKAASNSCELNYLGWWPGTE